MTEEFIRELRKGIETEYGKIYAKKIDEGRINNQKYLEMYLKSEDFERLIFYMSVYMGRRPYYKPWIEIFGIKNDLYKKGRAIRYFGTDIEDEIIDRVSESLGAGGRIFVEYSHDKETRYGLLRDYPEVTTRMGYELFKRDFTWFKDWYYPEGFNEGGEKLQAEKPLDKKHEKNHYQHMEEDIDRFLKGDFERNRFYKKAEKRAKEIIDRL